MQSRRSGCGRHASNEVPVQAAVLRPGGYCRDVAGAQDSEGNRSHIEEIVREQREQSRQETAYREMLAREQARQAAAHREHLREVAARDKQRRKERHWVQKLTDSVFWFVDPFLIGYIQAAGDLPKPTRKPGDRNLSLWNSGFFMAGFFVGAIANAAVFLFVAAVSLVVLGSWLMLFSIPVLIVLYALFGP